MTNKMKVRIRWDRNCYMAYHVNGYYQAYGDTIEQAYWAHNKLMCQLI